jgi:hypothetical protein
LIPKHPNMIENQSLSAAIGYEETRRGSEGVYADDA